MRVGVLTSLTADNLRWAAKLEFRAVAWMRFAASPAGPDQAEWRAFVEARAEEARQLDLRISAIGAYYANPLDPPQTDTARRTLERAIEVAAALGVRTVSGFSGSIVEPDRNPRGGHAVTRPFEESLPALLAFWEPIARKAADRGVRLAFENCPQARYHVPIAGYNAMSQPAMWERFFDATTCANIGLEWDPSHLICQGIDPVENLRRFGRRVFHVHAKDAFLNRELLRIYGWCHPGVAEHRFPGFGEAPWAEIIHELVRAGYDSDLNIEGWHDPVYRDHPQDAPPPLAGRRLEESGLRVARLTLERYAPLDLPLSP